MAWSQNRSSGNVRPRPAKARTPAVPVARPFREQQFGFMVAFSVVVHFALAGLGAAWYRWGTGPLLHLTPVTTVDLVALGPPPEAAPERAPERPSEPPRSKKSAPKPKEAPPKKEGPPVSRTAMATHDAKPDDTRSLNDTLARMKARKANEASASRAIEEKKAQAELANALKKMKDRAAHQVNLAAVGSPTGTSATADRLSEASPEQDQYATDLVRAIKRCWTKPTGSAMGLVATVIVKIQRDGYVPSTGVSIFKSSGNSYFDESVRRAIMKASPLPVPPAQLQGSETYFDVAFNFYDREDVN